MPKVKSRHQLRDLGPGRVYQARSSSDPMRVHMTVLLDTPLTNTRGTFEAVCTCPGFTNHRKCWHVTDVLTKAGRLEPGEDEDTVVLLENDQAQEVNLPESPREQDFDEDCPSCQQEMHVCRGCGVPAGHSGLPLLEHDADCPALDDEE